MPEEVRIKIEIHRGTGVNRICHAIGLIIPKEQFEDGLSDKTFNKYMRGIRKALKKNLYA